MGKNSAWNKQYIVVKHTGLTPEVLERNVVELWTPLHSSSSLEPAAFDPGEDTAQTNRDRADQLVADLLGAKIVFRRLEASCGRVVMPEGYPYSLQGFFIAVGPERYQFFTHASLKQFWTVEERTSQVVQIEPRVLCSGTFTQTYNSNVDVWLASDLSVQPKQGAPVINVEYQ
ncbi:farnesyltransferase alpha subunit [Culex quinquefasciatus]|uniref:Farnesyltransferase alpha subunit n=1 Tax=Culex quinquefasciatus TaxID=7176 RepID=B0WWI6_CULQU|nr:farnesyltransferase alpha subunit [Culex quinquefasciatus]|eukprot:XP_001861758.1 farnesyltransferase alpha subunit [Culex quinquefasciatus]